MLQGDSCLLNALQETIPAKEKQPVAELHRHADG